MHRSIENILNRRGGASVAVAAPADPLPGMVADYFAARETAARSPGAEASEAAWGRVFAVADQICETTARSVAGVMAQTRFLIDWRALTDGDAGSQFAALDAAILTGIATVEHRT